jgi:hypothetical protein
MRMTAAMFCAVITLLIGRPESANAGPWCVYYDPWTYNCGFQTLAQCRATSFADPGAYCSPNYREPPPAPRSRKRM